MKIILIALLVVFASSAFLERSHNYWTTSLRTSASSGPAKVPFVDILWNYCDLKCTYFEVTNPGYDFFVLNFKMGTFTADRSACYVLPAGAKWTPPKVASHDQAATATSGSTTASAGVSVTPKLWNTVVKNNWYETNCGSDDTDYLAEINKGNTDYGYKGSEGEGVGTEINY